MILSDNWAVLLVFLDISHAISICWWINRICQNIWTILCSSHLLTQAFSQHKDSKISREKGQKCQDLFKPQLETHGISLLLPVLVKANYKVRRDSRGEKIDTLCVWGVATWQCRRKIYRMGGITAVSHPSHIGNESFKQNSGVAIPRKKMPSNVTRL